MELRNAADLLDEVDRLRAAVLMRAETIAHDWDGWIERPDFAPSAANFAHYLALRRHDIRSLQLELAARGLSSLGRAESRVLPALNAVAAVLAFLAGKVSLRPIPIMPSSVARNGSLPGRSNYWGPARSVGLFTSL